MHGQLGGLGPLAPPGYASEGVWERCKLPQPLPQTHFWAILGPGNASRCNIFARFYRMQMSKVAILRICM